MFVTWTSLGMEGDGYVHYRKEGSTHIHTIRAHKTALIHTNRFEPVRSNGTARDNGRHERVTYVFKATMHHLEPSTRYGKSASGQDLDFMWIPKYVATRVDALAKSPPLRMHELRCKNCGEKKSSL